MLKKIEYTKVATTKKDMEAFFNAHCKNAKPDSAIGKIMANYKTAKADQLKEMVDQLNTMIDQFNASEAKKTASKSAKKTEEKPVASLKKSSKKTSSKTSSKPAKTKESLYPSSYETENNSMTKEAWNVDKLEANEVLVGRYFDIKKMNKKHVYSAKETAVQATLEKMKKEGSSPFPNNIDLYKVVNSNEELYILQSVITGSFTSLRKDVLKKSVEEDEIALYTMTAKEAPAKKPAPKKAPAKKKATTK